MQNKLKGTSVVPLFVAEAENDAGGGLVFKKFDYKDLDPSTFPSSPHARGRDVQFVIDDMKKSLPARENEFLNSIANTIDQLRKLQGFSLQKRGADEEELKRFVTRMMDELERTGK